MCIRFFGNELESLRGFWDDWITRTYNEEAWCWLFSCLDAPANCSNLDDRLFCIWYTSDAIDPSSVDKSSFLSNKVKAWRKCLLPSPQETDNTRRWLQRTDNSYTISSIWEPSNLYWKYILNDSTKPISVPSLIIFFGPVTISTNGKLFEFAKDFRSW